MFNFLKALRIEFSNITWLNRKELTNYSLIVLFVSILISMFLFINDIIFSKIILTIIHSQ